MVLCVMVHVNVEVLGESVKVISRSEDDTWSSMVSWDWLTLNEDQ